MQSISSLRKNLIAVRPKCLIIMIKWTAIGGDDEIAYEKPINLIVFTFLSVEIHLLLIKLVPHNVVPAQSMGQLNSRDPCGARKTIEQRYWARRAPQA